MENVLTVRELQESDISHIADYWHDSDPAFQIGMGVDLSKLGDREGLVKGLTKQIATPYEEKRGYAIIWELNGQSIGHCNVTHIVFGEEAKMHLHMWVAVERQKGLGTELVKKSIPYFFNNLKVKTLWCEPYALNPAPNRVLEKVGFEFIKQYRTVPGYICFEQEVKRWRYEVRCKM